MGQTSTGDYSIFNNVSHPHLLYISAASDTSFSSMHTISPTETEMISQCQHMMDCAVRFDIGVSAIKVECVLWCVIINEALKEE